MSLLELVLRPVLGRRVAAPAEIAPEIPARVVFREGWLIPAIGGVLGRMGGPAGAVTLHRTIVVRPGVKLTRRLLVHELTHVRQWEEDPLFPLRYTLESLRRGYRENRYEREAREAERAAHDTRPS